MPDSQSTQSSKPSTPRGPRTPTTPTTPVTQNPSSRRSSIVSWLSDVYTLFSLSGSDPGRLESLPRPAHPARSASSANPASRAPPSGHIGKMTVCDEDTFPELVKDLGTILVSRSQHQKTRDGTLRLDGNALRELRGETAIPLCCCDKTDCLSFHLPLYYSNFQRHYQLAPDTSSVRLDLSSMDLIEVDEKGSEYIGADLKGRFVQPREIFEWLAIPSPENQWTSQCPRPRKEGSHLCETCESWHNARIYGTQPPADSRGVRVPKWLRDEKRLVPESTMLEEAKRASQMTSDCPK